MPAGLNVICAKQTPCKCCGVQASLYGVVDFNKNCEIRRGMVLDVCGVPIYYHRCPACRFLFTTAFDHFTKEDFSHHIYNKDYAIVDPDYLEIRPRGNAAMIGRLFSEGRPERILDYGGGNGTLAESLRGAGFPRVETYDPFVPRHAARPGERFDCLLCFEVAEHTTDPVGTFADMDDLLTDSGLILFSTTLQPADIDNQGLNWWYAGPRNGHVSLYSKASLAKVVQRFGFKFGSFNDGYHVLFREIPEFARHFIKIH